MGDSTVNENEKRNGNFNPEANWSFGTPNIVFLTPNKQCKKRKIIVLFSHYVLIPFVYRQQAIVDLMDVLEQRKHEAILFTFKQVQ